MYSIYKTVICTNFHAEEHLFYSFQVYLTGGHNDPGRSKRHRLAQIGTYSADGTDAKTDGIDEFNLAQMALMSST